jgi:hypothetical protein
MNTSISLLAVGAVIALASCTAPYGNGTQRMTPRADVEAIERQGGNLPPVPDGGANAYNAVQYGLDNRFGGFHGYGRGTRY